MIEETEFNLIKRWLDGEFYLETLALVGIFAGVLFIWNLLK